MDAAEKEALVRAVGFIQQGIDLGWQLYWRDTEQRPDNPPPQPYSFRIWYIEFFDSLVLGKHSVTVYIKPLNTLMHSEHMLDSDALAMGERCRARLEREAA